MAIFLSVAGSLKYWRSDAPYSFEELAVSPAYEVKLADCAHALRDLDRYNSVYCDGESPLEVLVHTRAENRRGYGIVTRCIQAPLPEGSFFEIENDLYVCSPELIFLLAASMVPLRGLVTLGCELCGTYSLFSDTSSAIKHAQITDVATIGEYLKKVPGMRGIKLARQALSCVADGSASPRETDVYMQFCMRSKLAGFGLGGVRLNKTLDVDGRAKRFTDMEKITPDLYWPEHKLAIEYESTENHGAYVSTRELLSINRRRLASDSERRRTYKAMGIEALTVTDGEFCNYNEVERIAKLLAQKMGKHGLKDSVSLTFRRSELHEWLKVPVENREDVL